MQRLAIRQAEGCHESVHTTDDHFVLTGVKNSHASGQSRAAFYLPQEILVT